MLELRKHALDRPAEVYLDTGPTGMGKSFVDGLIARELQQSNGTTLTALPTHNQCDEVIAERQQQGIPAVAYPALNQDTCLRHDEAIATQGFGLSFTLALCPDCQHRDECNYREQLQAATDSPHAVATLARGAVSLPVIAEGRQYIAFHEYPLDMLRPTFVARHSLRIVSLLADEAAERAGVAADRGFYRQLSRVAMELHRELHGSLECAALPLRNPHQHIPESLHADLRQAILNAGVKQPLANALRLALAATEGTLIALAVIVEERPGKGGTVNLHQSLVGVTQTDLPSEAAIIFNDATGDPAELEAATGRRVRIITPEGLLERQHPVLQVVPATPAGDRDVTKNRQTGPVADLLRGILHDLPHYGRVGLLTHQRLSQELPEALGEPYASRLSLISYFHSGMSRGSNEWHRRCDLLVILGTPRIPTSAVREHLLQLGKTEAACLRSERAGWHREYWEATTESGMPRAVATPHYRDPDWHAAYCRLVISELKQSLGRGRGILPDGIPVYVVTTEDLGDGGIRLAEHTYPPLTQAQDRVLAALGQLSVGVPYSSLLGTPTDNFRPLPTAKIAAALGLSPERVKQLLGRLEADGRVKRVGKRGGWLLAEPPFLVPYQDLPPRTAQVRGKRKIAESDDSPCYWHPDALRGMHPDNLLISEHESVGTLKNRRRRQRQKAKERERHGPRC
jgi:hypothetical protein